MDNAWGLVTIVGPIILLAALAWAMLNNRRSKEAERRTEDATRRVRKEQDRADKANERV